MIEVRCLRKTFGEKTVLDGIDLRFEEEKIHFLIGRSGTGKSVLLKCLVGLLQPDSGEIWVGGKRVDGAEESVWREVRRQCGMVFQYPALLDSLSVRDNVAFGLRVHGETKDELHRVQELLDLVHVEEKWLNRFPTEMGYSLQKRVSIARTLALRPRYLLFDEPTTGLDPILTTRINSLIEDLTERLKITSLVVSHDMHCALKSADQIVLLDQGKVVAHGSTRDLEASSHDLARDFLREAKARRGE